MSKMEKTIELTSKMMELRRTARFLWGENYAERVSPYIKRIKEVMEEHKVNDVEAAYALIKLANETTLLTQDQREVSIMLITSALLDMNNA